MAQSWLQSCRAQSVYLTTRLLGRLSPLSSSPVLCTFFRQKLTTALLEWKGENDHRKYFMINLHERMLLTSAGVEPATSWSPVGRRIHLSHRDRLIHNLITFNVPQMLSGKAGTCTPGFAVGCTT